MRPGTMSAGTTTDEEWPEPPPPGPSLRARLAKGGGLGSRLAIGIPGVLVAIAVVVVGGGLFAAVVGLLAILALYEFDSLTAAWRPLRWAVTSGSSLPSRLHGGLPRPTAACCWASASGWAASPWPG